MRKWNLFTIMMVALFSIGFASCSSDDDDDISCPPELIGTWYNISGSRGYDISVTFNNDGTGKGTANKRKGLYLAISWVFNYKYTSNGDIVVDATEYYVDEGTEETYKRPMTFHYNNGVLTGIDSSNGNLEGCVFEKR